MLLYYPFWMFMGFILHIYIIFETNLRQRDFLEEYDPRDLEFTSEDPRGGQVIGGAPPCLVGPSSTPRPTSFAYIVPRTLKTFGEKIDREFRCRKPL